ncbi:MAG TPA: ATP-binding protein [Gemmatimonadales bacterium]|nr:ATP-binding protein [Gemmatimonadales bacterium]
MTDPAERRSSAVEGEVLLLLSDPEDAALLADLLARSRTVILGEGDAALDRDFDLAIVDGPVLQRLWRRIVERKRIAAPASLPFLLLATPADAGLFARFVWTAVDELIQAPVQAPELLARVDVLLRARAAARPPDPANERHRRFFENDLAGRWVAAADGRLVSCNLAFARMLGAASVEDACRNSWRDLLSATPAGEEFLARMARGDRIEAHEAMVRAADGTLIEGLLSTCGFREDGRLVETQGTLVDLAPRRQAEQRYWLGQRLATVGKLTAGIAHNYNNRLSTILGYSDLLLADLPLGDPRREDIEAIRAAALRSAELTRQLLAFSRQQVLHRMELDLNDVVSGMERAIRSVIGEEIVGIFELDTELPAVTADRSQIEQVLLNLVLNAREAMPGGGKLVIATSRLCLAAPDRSHEGVEIPAGAYAVLTVRDTGIGMDAETRARAFEPFYSTKPEGLGAGLGLPTAYGIVKQSGGFIWLESGPGTGTTARVYLPEDRASVPVAAASAGNGASAPRRGEAVLLVEDDDAVRVMAARALRQQGFAVLEANHGAAALAALNEHAGRLDILVTDVVMPEMDGVELAQAVTRLRPETRVLYMSGYAQRDLLSGAATPGATLLQKPFRVGELVGAIRKVLDAAPGTTLNLAAPIVPTDAA